MAAGVNIQQAARDVAQDPNSALAQLRLGEALADQGRQQEALFRFRKAASLDETLAAPLVESARILAAQGQLNAAEADLRSALQRDPAAGDAYLGLGAVLLGRGQIEDAVAMWQAVLPTASCYADAQIELGRALFALFRADESLAVFEVLRQAYPHLAAAHLGAGTALRSLGESEAAQAAYEKALELAPGVPTLHRAVAEGKTFTPDDPQLAAMAAIPAERVPPEERVSLHFALAKAYDDIGDAENAFEQWRKGNGVKRRLIGYNEAVTLGHLARLQAVFSPALLKDHAGEGSESAVPVFIVGMPRSGTTLVEQILAAHPDVLGGGEQRYLSDAIEQGLAGPAFPEAVSSLQAADWRTFGEAYVARLRQGALRVTDKLPANFRNIGLIHLALPKARIIHVRRDPLDTCFSCYSNLFPGGLEYTYDLGELARYYRAYDALIAHWRAVLPESAMLDVQYEDLVGDIEAGARRLIDYCGLAWDARCLDFHRAKRAIYTVSVTQARKPLYASSVGRWKRYAGQLAPLEAALKR